MAIKVHHSIAVHPGEFAFEHFVKGHGLNVSEVARGLGVSRQSMSELLNGHNGMSADMAIRFEKAFGVSAETLLRMQARHDLAKAREHEGDLKVERFAAAA